jgi:hypothetical protein
VILSRGFCTLKPENQKHPHKDTFTARRSRTTERESVSEAEKRLVLQGTDALRLLMTKQQKTALNGEAKFIQNQYSAPAL